MKSFLSLILEDEIGIWENLDKDGNRRQGDLFKGKFPDKNKAMLNFSQYKKMLGNIDPKTTSVQTPEDLADKLAQGKPAAKVRTGIDPHTNELDATRAAKAQANTAARQVAKEMRSAANAKLTPKDIAMLKNLEGRPGMQISMGILGPEDLNSALRQAKFGEWGGGSHVTPTRVSAAGSQGTVKSGSLQGTPKPAPRTPLLFDPETHLGGRPTSGSMQSMKPKGAGLANKFVRAGRAVLRNPITRIGGKALGGAATLLAPAIHVADAKSHADTVAKREFDAIAAAKKRGENPYNAAGMRDHAFTELVRQGSKFR